VKGIKNRLKLLVTIFLSTCAGSGYGQRYDTIINSGWKFIKADDAVFANPEFNDQDWQEISLPHCWNAKDALETNDYYRGPGWYRKILRYPIKTGKRYFLHFEGAFEIADVYVNGVKAGHHIGGYTGFTYDITSWLKTGDHNEIAVRVDNSKTFRDTVPPYSADFTMWGGLYRDVRLIETNEIHFRMDDSGSKGIFFDTPEVNEQSATMVIRGNIKNDLISDKELNVSVSLKDSAGNNVHQLSSPVKVTGGKSGSFEIQTKIKFPHLWSPEDPYLYHVSICLKEKGSGEILDRLSDHLGFRWFSADTRHGFMLNGKPLKLKGVCRHQDFPGIGNAMSDDMQRRDAQLIKEMGANFVRIAHYPQDQSFLDACDREGILAWEEIPIVNYVPDNSVFAQNCKNNLEEMIRQNYNHPSIVMWGYMNEGLMDASKERDKIKQQEIAERTVILAKELEKMIKKEDPRRLTTMAWNDSQIYNQCGMGDIPEIIGWNMYNGWYGNKISDFGVRIDEEHGKYPDRPLFISEYGAGSDKRLHSLQPEQFDFSMEYQQLFHESYFPQILKRKYIIGSTIWNLIDFGSAFRQESMPHMNNKGLLYSNREPKDIYFYYKSMLRSNPVIHIASRDWNERKGIPAGEGEQYVRQPVKIYSNLSGVELIANGKSLGIQHPVNCNTAFEVPFVAGNNILIAKSAVPDSPATDVMTVNFQMQPYDLRTEGDKTEIGVNAGSNCFYTDPDSHFIYEPDQPYQRQGSWGYEKGTAFRSRPTRIGIQSDIQGTTQTPLYQSMREGTCAYRFDVPQGDYEITLMFADPDRLRDTTGNNRKNGQKQFTQRVFNVEINGLSVLHNFDPGMEYAPLTAVEKVVRVNVKESEALKISFIPEQGEPIISALKVRRVY